MRFKNLEKSKGIMESGKEQGKGNRYKRNGGKKVRLRKEAVPVSLSLFYTFVFALDCH